MFNFFNSFESSTTKQFKYNSYVYNAVTKISNAIASVELFFYENGRQLTLENNIKHPIIQLFNTPFVCGINGLSEFLQTIIIQLELNGNVFFKPVFSANGSLLDFDLLLARRIEAIIKNDILLGWKFTNADMKVNTYTVAELLHFKYAGSEKFIGLAPLQAALVDAQQATFAKKWNTAFFKHPAYRNPFAFVTDKILSKIQRNSIVKNIKDEFAGDRSLERPLILEGGNVVNLFPNKRDLDFVQSLRLNREDLFAVFGVPPAVAGIYEYANYANAKEQERLFWTITIIPKMILLQKQLQYFVSRFFTDVTIAWDWEAVEAKITSKLDTAKIGYYESLADKNKQNNNAIVNNDTEKINTENSKNTIAVKSDKSNKINGAVELVKIEKKIQEKWIAFVKELKTFFKQNNTFDGLLIDVESWSEKWNTALFEYQKEAFATAYLVFNSEFENLIEEHKLKIKQVDLRDIIDDQSMLDALNENLTNINNKTKALTSDKLSKLNSITNDLITSGATVTEIQTALDDAMFEFASNSLTVARTAAGGAYSAARFQMLQLNGVYEHAWQSANDSEVRDSHKKEHGNIVIVGVPFPTTGLLYPLDSNGPVAEIVNCRCTTKIISIIDAEGNIIKI